MEETELFLFCPGCSRLPFQHHSLLVAKTLKLELTYTHVTETKGTSAVQILLISNNSAVVLIHTIISNGNHTYWQDFGGTCVTSLSVLS